MSFALSEELKSLLWILELNYRIFCCDVWWILNAMKEGSKFPRPFQKKPSHTWHVKFNLKLIPKKFIELSKNRHLHNSSFFHSFWNPFNQKRISFQKFKKKKKLNKLMRSWLNWDEVKEDEEKSLWHLLCIKSNKKFRHGGLNEWLLVVGFDTVFLKDFY
jgi:hypothetical protein